MFLKRKLYRVLDVVARRWFASRLIPEGRTAENASRCIVEWENGDRWLVDLSAPFGCRIRRSACGDPNRARRDISFTPEPSEPTGPGSMACRASWSPVLFLRGLPVAYWCDDCQGIHDFR